MRFGIRSHSEEGGMRPGASKETVSAESGEGKPQIRKHLPRAKPRPAGSRASAARHP